MLWKGYLRGANVRLLTYAWCCWQTKSFHKPLHFTILPQTWFASFSTKTIKNFMITTCSKPALYKHGHITYLKRHLPSTFKIRFIPHKSYKGISPGPLSELINQLLCFRKWTSLCYVIHSNKSMCWLTNSETSVLTPNRRALHYKFHHHFLIQTYSFLIPTVGH